MHQKLNFFLYKKIIFFFVWTQKYNGNEKQKRIRFSFFFFFFKPLFLKRGKIRFFLSQKIL